MSAGLAMVVILIAGILALLVAGRTRPELVGTVPPSQPSGAGHHATATSWLMTGPMPSKHHALDLSRHAAMDRLVRALVMRRARQDRTGWEEALQNLQTELQDNVARAVLRGDMGAAQRAQARRLHRGPEGAFAAWYLFVALPRYGRRGLRQAAMRHTVEVCR